ncbi:TIGR02530 family flagellar biosynthesis protein [Metabacillus malikii]|uniref:Flagellar operon protein n=1 Tax=Metabacillus malikii TaxID=1504265 RepID=A0ABT9ZE38_9BACI|nr:TIGR02530 family flagellar biosynthesis protein [Metabacillus malikii]MDQ0230529.1 flagellar operon protein [Metabacillus malikii]
MKININHINQYQPHNDFTKCGQQKISFKHLLSDNLHDTNIQLKISKHAQERLTQRDIVLSDDDWASIKEKVNEARLKGVNDSLVLVNDAALIINAQNSTVITALDREEAKSQLFTNITGAIIMD